MAFPGLPYTCQCTQCGWKKTIRPDSDVKIRGYDLFDKCPKCGGKVETHLATSQENFFTKLGKMFGG